MMKLLLLTFLRFKTIVGASKTQCIHLNVDQIFRFCSDSNFVRLRSAISKLTHSD